MRHTSKGNGEHEDNGGEKYGSIENAEKKAQYQDGLHKEQYWMYGFKITILKSCLLFDILIFLEIHVIKHICPR